MPTQTPASAPRGTQKVSRSAVAAPARKPTTKQKKSAPSPRRRPKKPNIFVRFLHGLVRRLYFGSKTLFKFALFIPILVFMVWFSYTVDRSGLFQGELAPRRIVDLMLQGYDVSNFEQMNEIEREVVQLFAQDVPGHSGSDRHWLQPRITVHTGTCRNRQFFQHGRYRRGCAR